MKKSELQFSRYRYVSTDPIGIGRGSLRIRGAQFGNRYSNLMMCAQSLTEGSQLMCNKQRRRMILKSVFKTKCVKMCLH